MNFEDYIEEGQDVYILEEGYLKEDSLGDFCEEGSLRREDCLLGSTDICLGPEGGRGGLTGRWLGNY